MLTGALFVTVRDSVTGHPLEGANVFIVGSRVGGISDSLGQVWLTEIPWGTRVLKSFAITYHARLDTLVVRERRCDSVRIELRRYKHIKVDGDLIEVWD